ncbi:MAG: flagellar hook-length control protein FliK [Pseudorhizobium sp.]
MASALDLVFRPLETQVQDAPNRRPAHPGSGEEFAGLLSKARDSLAEQAEINVPPVATVAAMVPPLPAETGLLALPTLSEDELSSLPLAFADPQVPTVPTRALQGASLPAAEISEGEPTRDLTQPIKTDFEPAVPETMGELVSKPEVSRPSPRETPDIKGELEPVSPVVSDETLSKPDIGRPESGRLRAEPRDETIQISEAPPAVPRIVETADVNVSVPAAAAPDVQKPSVSASPATPRASEPVAPAAVSVPPPESPPVTRTPRAAPAPRSGEGAETAPASDGQDFTINQTFAATPSLNIAAAEAEVPSVTGRPVIAAPAVLASSPSILPRSPAKLGIAPASDAPPSPSLAQLPDTFEVPDPVLAGEPLVSGDTGSVSASSAPAIAVASAAPVAVQAASVSAPVPAVMAPSNAILVATPADVAGIVSSAADNGEPDRIVIQLDPPELGRVSIDFKFDSNGLQHVTVTGETPDALRQLRLMHYELTQALERHGLGSQNMTFQQQHQNAQPSPAPNPFARQGLLSDAGAAATLDPLIAKTSQTSPRTMPGGRLDMKL